MVTSPAEERLSTTLEVPERGLRVSLAGLVLRRGAAGRAPSPTPAITFSCRRQCVGHGVISDVVRGDICSGDLCSPRGSRGDDPSLRFRQGSTSPPARDHYRGIQIRVFLEQEQDGSHSVVPSVCHRRTRSGLAVAACRNQDAFGCALVEHRPVKVSDSAHALTVFLYRLAWMTTFPPRMARPS